MPGKADPSYPDLLFFRHSIVLVGEVEVLRDRLHTSIYILVKIPVEIHNLAHGQNHTCMDSGRIPAELGHSELDIQSLFQRGLICLLPKKPRTKERVT